jgi:asparagine synthase (glutamine-hydrolysing)
MCGICGVANFDPRIMVEKRDILPVLGMLRHRGPDDEGLFWDDNVIFGHRRLSIIDLDGGHQPIFNEERSVCAIVNGEIYNYLELRRDLENSHVFATQSDAEVIVHLWEEFGEKCVDHLRGMFALAIYDMTRKTVFLARDRFGQKPLVYADTPHGFYFLSEIYPLTQIPHVDTTLCHRALDDFLSLHYIPAPATIYKGIKKLQPAHMLIVSSDGIKVDQYWSIDPFNRTADSYETAELKVCDLIEDSVRYRMIADVPVGAFSSGGVDSSLVIAFARRIEPVADIQTVCIGFDEHRYDERPFARQVAEKFGMTHHEHVLTPDILGILDQLVCHYGEPYGDPSAIPTWYLSQVTASHVKVALSGDGGDEVFAGYNRYDSTALVEIYQRLPRVVRKGMIESVANAFPDMCWGEGYVSQVKQFMRGASEHPVQRLILRNSVFSPKMKSELYTDTLKGALSGYDPAARFSPAYNALTIFSEAEKLQLIDLGVFLPDDILTKVDIASMAHSLEVRCPLLDHKLAEYVLSLPFEYKHKIFRRKRILKTVGKRFFDADFLNRKKKGFRLPIGQWFRTSLKKPLLYSLTNSPIFVDSKLFDLKHIKQVFDEHQSKKINHGDRLWNLWILGEWSKSNSCAFDM